MAHMGWRVRRNQRLQPTARHPRAWRVTRAGLRDGFGLLVWFGFGFGTGPRHRNDLLSGRFALASSCAVATYWSMPPLTAGGLL